MAAYPALTTEEVEALQAFAAKHGRNWKANLSMVYWYNARIWRGPHGDDNTVGYVLHGLRNSHGPSWLDSYRLPKK